MGLVGQIQEMVRGDIYEVPAHRHAYRPLPTADLGSLHLSSVVVYALSIVIFMLVLLPSKSSAHERDMVSEQIQHVRIRHRHLEVIRFSLQPVQLHKKVAHVLAGISGLQ